ncbi:hypothetical protein ACFPAF_20475 [Hymenobacter endophyticus]|uniref:Uncharacterized protein n=1 Tax=Hymenobacter endophyticus TaxID=3076335 RepID=A0ABU3TN35_9BACT|nr:hypothetical protein [Hymenobacter endophyticus]MDU0372787.1 hypothetical protein [Hymenobacter endophyticus]
MVGDVGPWLDMRPVFGLMLAFLLLAGLLMVAFTSAYCARSHGRSFWLWFALSLVLPVVSYFVLFALILHQHMNQGQRLLNEARAILAAAARAAHPEEH